MTHLKQLSEKTLFRFLSVYSVILFVAAFFIVQNFAIFYYWDWGRHLALSYFDGPPMIAYILRATTTIFGNHLFVINLLAVFFSLAIATVIYKTVELIANRRVALIASALWLLSPFTMQYMVRYITYDAPLNLFWITTLYFALKYDLQEKTQDLYFLGISIGMMMLSKYTGGLLVLLLMAFVVITPKHRALFKSKHFYLSMMIACLLFSPVIIWNIQHHWISFTYQFHDHNYQSMSVSDRLHQVGVFLSGGLLATLNFLLFIVLYGRFAKKSMVTLGNSGQMLRFITLGFYLFYTVASFKVRVLSSWLMPGLLGVVILASLVIEHANLRKTLLFILGFYFLVDVTILLIDSVYKKELTLEGAREALALEFSQQHSQLNEPLFTNDYLTARLVFFLKNQPNIYALGHGANEYHYWSAPMLSKIKNGEIQKGLYFSFLPKDHIMLTYFKSCHALPVITYQQKNPFLNDKVKSYHLYSYQCGNHLGRTTQ